MAKKNNEAAWWVLYGMLSLVMVGFGLCLTFILMKSGHTTEWPITLLTTAIVILCFKVFMGNRKIVLQMGDE